MADNRRGVLGYPDLARKLTEPPIGFERPEQWNGFVPPEQWREQHNDSARREALVELVAEAARRDVESGESAA